MMLTTTSGHGGMAFVPTVLRAIVVLLTLTTAAIHLRLGGPLFTLNAVGYAVLATAMVLPGPAGRVRWLARLGLIAFTLATIGGWVLFGPRFSLAYVDKAVELALVIFLAAEVWFVDGGPAGTLARAREAAAGMAGLAARGGGR